MNIRDFTVKYTHCVYLLPCPFLGNVYTLTHISWFCSFFTHKRK